MNQGVEHTNRLAIIGKIRDLVAETTSYTDPFLYYLPDILTRPEFLTIDAQKVLDFLGLALTYERPPVVSDAIGILNKLVRHEDGSLNMPGPDIFYEKQHFLWKELGGHTTAVDVIAHVLNKTLFICSLGIS